jgi:hypothetical protein
MTVERLIFTNPTVGNTDATSGYVKGGTLQGDEEVLLTADMTTRELLEGIFIELKKLNLRQQEAFEEQVNDEDVL